RVRRDLAERLPREHVVAVLDGPLAVARQEDGRERAAHAGLEPLVQLVLGDVLDLGELLVRPAVLRDELVEEWHRSFPRLGVGRRLRAALVGATTRLWTFLHPPASFSRATASARPHPPRSPRSPVNVRSAQGTTGPGMPVSTRSSGSPAAVGPAR